MSFELIKHVSSACTTEEQMEMFSILAMMDEDPEFAEALAELFLKCNPLQRDNMASVIVRHHPSKWPLEFKVNFMQRFYMEVINEGIRKARTNHDWAWWIQN